MNNKEITKQIDNRPLEFTIAVIGGGVGCSTLSAFASNPWISVGFALSVMGGLSFIRWREAYRIKDSVALEMFSEDVYLLGYLLTLASLLGLAPRLAVDDTNLFAIAGVKLFTTVTGLGTMMIFRQLARSWAAAGRSVASLTFQQQEDLFHAAVGRLNQSAEELTSKMEDVARRFDPDLLGPVAEWSNRAANSLSSVSRAFDAVPVAVAPCLQKFSDLAGELERLSSAVTELYSDTIVRLDAAMVGLTNNVISTDESLQRLNLLVVGLQSATQSGQAGLERLGAQAIEEVGNLDKVNISLKAIAKDLINVEDVLRQLGNMSKADPNPPLAQLVLAIDTAVSIAKDSSSQLEDLMESIQGVVASSQKLGERFGTELSKSIAKQESLQALTQERISAISSKLIASINELSTSHVTEKNKQDSHFAIETIALRKTIEQVGSQIKMLIEKRDESENKSIAKESSGLLGINQNNLLIKDEGAL